MKHYGITYPSERNYKSPEKESLKPYDRSINTEELKIYNGDGNTEQDTSNESNEEKKSSSNRSVVEGSPIYYSFSRELK